MERKEIEIDMLQNLEHGKSPVTATYGSITYILLFINRMLQTFDIEDF